MTTELKASDYSVGWICAIPIELTAVLAILDETYPRLDAADGDTDVYKFGRIGRHNVVISCLPAGRYGVTSASIAAAHLRSKFSKLRFGLMVGVGGGAPSADNDIRLGDLVISQPKGVSGGVIQYDFGAAMENGEFLRIGSLNAPPSILLNAVAFIKAKDQAKLGQKISEIAQEIEENDSKFQYPGQETDILFRADYNHVPSEGRQRETCKSCDTSKIVPRPERKYDHPYFHYGIIASGNQVIKDAIYAKELLLQIPAVSKDEADGADTQRENIKEINFVIPFHMPFFRSNSFVGRAETLKQVHEYFSDSNLVDTPRIFALIGTGGMGKTQTALEYAYRHRHDYTAVFWISAASETTIRTSFIDIMQRIVKEQARITWPESPPDYQVIGSKLGIPGLIHEKGTINANLESFDNIRLALFSWLQLPGNNRWLLIVDNADDLETFSIEEYLPNQGSGAIFITSRRPEFSQSAKQVGLEGLDSKSAVALLLNLAHLTDSGVLENEAMKLVEKLGFMPLAISHAGCYIHETKLPLSNYLPYYNKAFMALQSRKPRFGWNYRNDTAATTWEISFSKVEERDKEAALLLLVCSYLNPEEIFDNLWEDELLDNVEIKNKILLLASYSLVKIIRFGIFSVHPVVHSWARERSGQPECFKTIRHAVMILGKASQRGDVSRNSNEWEAREGRRVVSHLEYLHQHLKPLLFTFLQEERGSKNQILFDYVHSIAIVFFNQGKYDEAMQWYKRALAGFEKAFGKDHPLTLTIFNNIAGVFFNQSKYDEAMQWYERALASKEKVLGKNHPSTFDTVHGIATVFDEQGRYDEAIKWYKRALAGYEKVLVKTHPSILSTIHNIAVVFSKQRKYDEAIQ
ncbi:hypothetical protein TWF128_000417 [Orbilia oligospora]|nr:hypothetical protein TWF128_000417 [Orbilia oligospora]